MARFVNPCAKTVKREVAYEVWASSDFSWLYYVLKKWQVDDNKPYARWYCNVVSPMTSERGETGDVYVSQVKTGNQLILNPLRPIAETMKAYEVEVDPFWHTTWRFGDGYDVMEHAHEHRWLAVSAWGKDGWDLGSWPLVIVFVRNRDGKFQVIEYVEGDATMWSCPSKLMRQQIIDSLAFFHWKHQGKEWVKDFDSIDTVPVDSDLRGMYRG